MVKHYDVIVIGGGVIGGSLAYYLTTNGRRVLLLEQSKIGSGSSQAAAGMLGAQTEMNSINPLFKLAVRSRAMFPKLAVELKELSGIDIELSMHGFLKVATSVEQAEHYIKVIELQRSSGEVAEWLTREEALKYEPLLNDGIYGAMFFPNEGQVVAPKLTQAFVLSAQKIGAVVQEQVKVQSFIVQNGDIQGVHTDNGPIYAEQVVLAAGVCSKALLEQIGIELDMYPVKGECFSVIDSKDRLKTTIFSEGCYLVPKREGRIVVGATMYERQASGGVTIAGMRQLLERAIKLFPSLDEMSFERSWSGLRPQTPDGLPIIGAAPNCKGLFIATGHYRNGILLSPATGKGLAELMNREKNKQQGRQSKELLNIDLSPFGLERFELAASNQAL